MVATVSPTTSFSVRRVHAVITPQRPEQPSDDVEVMDQDLADEQPLFGSLKRLAFDGWTFAVCIWDHSDGPV